MCFGSRAPIRLPPFRIPLIKVYLRHQLAFLAIIGCLTTILNTALYKINGPGVTCASIWKSHMDRGDAKASDAIIFYLVVGSFLDIAETVLFISQYKISLTWTLTYMGP